MKIQCETCGGRVEVDKNAAFIEGSADVGLAMVAYISFLLGSAALAAAPSIAVALLLRKSILKAAKKSVGPLFKCSKCGKGASYKHVLSQITSK